MMSKEQTERAARVAVEQMRLDAMEQGATLEDYMTIVAARIKMLDGSTVSTASCEAFINDMVSLGYLDGERKPAKGGW